jgi:sensor histidine kinase YesM
MHGPLEKPVVIQPERVAEQIPRVLVYWVLQIVCWWCYYWGQASGEVIFASKSWREAGTLWGIVTVSNLVLTHAIRGVARRYSWLTLRPGDLILRAVVAGLIAAAISYGVLIVTSLWVYGTPIAPILGAFYAKLPLNNQLFNQFVSTALFFFAWVSAYFAIVTQRHRYQEDVRQAQLSEALQAAELRLLKSQLNPHFLFNALNGVRALIADEPAKAQGAVTQLARTLRYTLAAGETELVTVAREMEMVDDYLALESMRLAERLQIVRDVDPQAADARIPVMLLQSLVENAIKHGIAPLKRGGTLRISAQVVGGELRIEIENPRASGPVTQPESQGVGLTNASKRLRLLFGPAATLHLDLSDSQRAIARVRLPA